MNILQAQSYYGHITPFFGGGEVMCTPRDETNPGGTAPFSEQARVLRKLPGDKTLFPPLYTYTRTCKEGVFFFLYASGPNYSC